MRRTLILHLPLLAAIAIGLSGCSTTAPPAQSPDAEIASEMERGRRAFARRHYDMALHAFQNSLLRARMLDDPNGIGDSAHNLAAVHIAQGKYEDAQPYLDEAHAAFTRARTRTAVAEVHILMARLAIAQKDKATAQENLANAIDAIGETTRRSDVAATAYLLQAELACDRGDVGDAKTAIEAALGAGAHKSDSATVRAQTYTAAGKLAVLNGAKQAAARNFDDAAAAYGSANQPRNVADALVAAGDNYAAADRTSAAAERYYRAARSYHAQGLLRQAIAQITAALATAEQSGDEGLIRRTKTLLNSIKETLEKATR